MRNNKKSINWAVQMPTCQRANLWMCQDFDRADCWVSLWHKKIETLQQKTFEKGFLCDFFQERNVSQRQKIIIQRVVDSLHQSMSKQWHIRKSSFLQIGLKQRNFSFKNMVISCNKERAAFTKSIKKLPELSKINKMITDATNEKY